ncbi:MAG: zinc ABC transporter substrate-binding protein ZnuA [Alphaproteobacteria bacterium]
MHSKSLIAATVLSFAAWLSPAAAEPPRVVATIKPVHSLVAGVMQGVATPHLLLKGAASPHAYAMTPSDAAALQGADLVVWVGEGMETFLLKPMAALPKRTRVLALDDAPGIALLDVREGGAWDEHDDHGHEHGHEHEEAKDMHLWLDPMNAQRAVEALADTLSGMDPANAARYAANAEAVLARLDTLDGELRETLAPLRGRPYIVFHDAYHYFEQSYGLSAVGSITVNPDVAPGAKTLRAIRKKLTDSKARCVFREPQFTPKLVATVTEGLSVKTGILDPLGADLPEGPDAYFLLMRNLADGLRTCLM